MKKAALSRRDFLKAMGATAAAVSVTGLLGGCSQLPDSDGIPDTPSTENILWTIRDNGDGTARLIGYDESGPQPSGYVVLPEEVSEKKIAQVSLSLVECKELVRVAVPATVKEIEQLYAPNMKVLTLSEGLETIGRDAFSYCNDLQSVSLPQSLKVIEEGAFHNCRDLEEVSFPQSMEKIGPGAFARTQLGEVVLPSDVEISYGAFYNVTTLKRVVLNANTSFDCYPTFHGVFENCTSLETVTFNSSVMEIGARMFAFCSALASITLPYGVQKIGEAAFQKCTALKQLQLPLSVTEIGDFAFIQCSALVSVTGLYGSTSVGRGLFKECTALEKFEVPAGASKIPEQTFDGCTGLRKIYIPSSVNTIESAFSKCSKLTDVYYQGTSEMWANVSIADSEDSGGNAALSRATLHYGARPSDL